MTDQKVTQRVLAKDPRGRAETRRFGFSPVSITATTEATAQVIVAAGEGEVVEISALNVSHAAHSGGGATVDVSFCIVGAGDAPSAANVAVDAANVVDGTVLDLGARILLNRGQSLYAFSSDADHLRVSGWVTAHL